MHYIRLISTVFLAGGMMLGGSPLDDPGKPGPSPTAKPSATISDSANAQTSSRTLPPVLRTVEKEDNLVVRLPGPAAPPPAPAPPVRAASSKLPGPPPLPEPDPDQPVLRRATLSYPPEFGTESAMYCQKQITTWSLADALGLFGDPKGHRASLDEEGNENGDIYLFSDPSSRYRELELDFDRANGTLRTVFAYPWKMSWVECRKLWGAKVTSAEAEKGRTFYSYLDRRLDVLVDETGKVISFGLY